METQQREKKFQRTTQEQLQCYIAYIKKNPELVTGKNTPAQPRQVQDLWEELANNLNALNGPTRTPIKWKESLANWKKQLRSRARRLKADQMGTGGGPKPADLGDFDSQALEAMGMMAVDGIPAQELGFQDTVCSTAHDVVSTLRVTDTVCSTEHEEVSALQVTVEEPCSPPVSNSPLCRTNIFSRSDISSSNSPIEATPSRTNNKRGGSQELVDVVLKHIRKREEYDGRMLEQQTRTNDALAKLGEGFLALAEAMKKP
ncbi:PREDICTED: uncharacterized protein LOC108365901 [Rhagoletis zephyria]|uniref:uncharacterized protein LOC108365901 n=1 Tax=Rhagoletis zephyria TaxID=28612 RepID=UPI0008116243|nr:PREDICTED: uncharacterized protein LOC108365901 [Rhagoletis zephyria]